MAHRLDGWWARVSEATRTVTCGLLVGVALAAGAVGAAPTAHAFGGLSTFGISFADHRSSSFRSGVALHTNSAFRSSSAFRTPDSPFPSALRIPNAEFGMFQAKSGPRSIDACGVLTEAELTAIVKRKVRPRAVPASQPASLGVSVCMYATTDGLHTVSVTTYGPEAIQRTQSKTLQAYYDAMKTSNAQAAGKPPVVIPGAGRHATFFVNPRNAGDVLLVLRTDCVVIANLNGFTRDEALATGKAIGG